jgi:hypothetical protein
MILTSGGSNSVITAVKHNDSKYLEVKGQYIIGSLSCIDLCHVTIADFDGI